MVKVRMIAGCGLASPRIASLCLLCSSQEAQKYISDIDEKIISMYAKGMTTRQCAHALYKKLYGQLKDCYKDLARL